MDRLLLILAFLLAAAPALAQPFPPEIVPDAYALGLRAERDGAIRTAIEYYMQAARQKEPAAADRLAEIYEQGYGGIKRDATESAKWRNASRFLRGQSLPVSLYEQAEAAEHAGDGRTAVKLYVRAARMGDGRAAKRLSEIYDKGAPGSR